MVNRFENITDSVSFIQLLNSLKVHQDCCRNSILISPSGQKYQLKPVIDFAKNKQFLFPVVISQFTKLNTALKTHTFSLSSENCFQWIWQLLLRLGHALAKLFGGVSSQPDLQSEINTLAPNWMKELLPPLPVVEDPSKIRKDEGQKRDELKIGKPPVVDKSEEEKFLQDYKLNVNTRELRALFFTTHLDLYVKGELKQENGFLLLLQEFMKLHVNEAVQICAEKIDVILNLGPKSPFVKWFLNMRNDGNIRDDGHNDLYHTAFYRGLITAINKKQFIKLCEIAFTPSNANGGWLLSQMLDHILKTHHRDQEVICLLLAQIPLETVNYVTLQKLIKDLSPSSLKEYCKKYARREQLRDLICLLPYENIGERIDAMLLGIAEATKSSITIESMIKEELFLDEHCSQGMNYLARLSICNDLKMLQSELSVTEKQKAISSRVKQLKFKYSNKDSEVSKFCLEEVFSQYIKHMAADCDPNGIPILLMAVANEPLVEGETLFANVFKKVLQDNKDAKITQAFVTLWPLLDDTKKEHYLSIEKIFENISNIKMLGLILSTFPPFGETKWLMELFFSCIRQQNSKDKFPQAGLAALLQQYPHLYCLLDPVQHLGSLFDAKTIIQVDQARTTYIKNLSAELLRNHPLSGDANNVILSYLLNEAAHRKIEPSYEFPTTAAVQT